MKLHFFKNIAPAVLSAMLLSAGGFTSCADDLNQSSIDPQTKPSADQDAYYAKIYALMVMSGQQGSGGNPDISDDPGRNPFFRRMWELNEFTTDECLWNWLGNAGQTELVNLSYGPSDLYARMYYNRLGYNVTQCNYFLDLYSGKTDDVSRRQCAEVRFFRAMYYQYFLDAYGRAPFSETFSNALPEEKVGKDLFDYIEKEYKAIDEEGKLDEAKPDAANFGRVNKAAVWMMLSRLYLNAEVYAGTPRWEDARAYANKVITESQFSLAKADKTASVNGRDTTYTAYQQLFMGDNDRNAEAMKEIIFPIRQDGLNMKTYGGSWTIIGSLSYSNCPRDFFGMNDSWTCLRARAAGVKLFIPQIENVPLTNDPLDIRRAANDDRALFYAGEAGDKAFQVENTKLGDDHHGLMMVKWTNLHADGTTDYHDSKVPDTDIPFLRLAEAYLTRAEANFRLGADKQTVLNDVNELRNRAHATPWNANDVTEMNILSEWGREFYLEGHRRTDLIRFDCFTTNKYLWDWKCGVQEGAATRSYFNLLPIPDTELTNNPKMHQNPGYAD